MEVHELLTNRIRRNISDNTVLTCASFIISERINHCPLFEKKLDCVNLHSIKYTINLILRRFDNNSVTCCQNKSNYCCFLCPLPVCYGRNLSFYRLKTRHFSALYRFRGDFFKSCSLFGIPVIVSSRTAFINVLNCGTNLGREPRMKDCVSLYLCKYRSYMSEKIQQLCQQLNNIYTYLNDQFQYCMQVCLSQLFSSFYPYKQHSQKKVWIFTVKYSASWWKK